MLRKLISISIICCVLGSVLQFTIPLSWYVANYDFISTELCINKDNPNIECNGICQLENKIQNDQDQEDKKQTTVEQGERIQFFINNWNHTTTAPRLDERSLGGIYKMTSPTWFSEPSSPPPKLG